MNKTEAFSFSIIFLIFFQFLVANCFDMAFDQFLSSTPSTFGLITVTHARKGMYTYFNNHLNMYATMDCAEMIEISVVWNNDITPQQAGIKQDSNWKRPVYFSKTPYNSMDFRYQVSQESKAKVFFEIDDDVIVSCEELRKSFAVWKKNAIGDVSPLVSYGPRGFDFDSKKQSFIYTDPLKAKFYSISLVGIAWISRFYFDLYNSEKSWEINKMREIVRQKNNCDDLALNFIVSYFFPQMLPVSVQGNLKMQIHPDSQGLSKTHYQFRNECLKKFTQILGYNPLRIINRLDGENPERFKSSSQKYSIYLKRKELSEKLIQKQTIYTPITNDQFSQMQQNLQKQISQSKEASPIPITNEEQNINRDEFQKLKKQIEVYRLQYNEMLQKNPSPKQSLSQNPVSQTYLTKINIINNSIDLIATISIIVGTLLIVSLCYLLATCCSVTSSQQVSGYEVQKRIRKQQVINQNDEDEQEEEEM